MKNYIPHVLWSFVISLGVITSTWIASKTIKEIKLKEYIDVKGYAEKKIFSESGCWEATISMASKDDMDARRRIGQKAEKIHHILKEMGFSPEEISFSSIRKNAVMAKTEKGRETNTLDYYELDQTIQVESKDIKNILSITKKIEPLNEQGIDISFRSPQFYYPSDKMDQVKVELLGEATQNARNRALKIATNGGAKIGRLIKARQGIFQVTAPNSSDMSDHGVYDTYSVEKVVKIVVTMGYSIVS